MKQTITQKVYNNMLADVILSDLKTGEELKELEIKWENKLKRDWNNFIDKQKLFFCNTIKIKDIEYPDRGMIADFTGGYKDIKDPDIEGSIWDVEWGKVKLILSKIK